MRALSFFIVAVLATEATSKCAANDCLRAVQKVTSSLRSEDCASFVTVTVTPATSTAFSTIRATTTGTTTSTTTETITADPEPSRRWLERHEVTDLLMGRAVNGPVTAKATAIPTYASLCASSGAYVSACSCLGVFPTTITAPTPSTTQVLRVVETITSTAVVTYHKTASYTVARNSSSISGNLTHAQTKNLTASYLNTTAPGESSIVSAVSGTSVLYTPTSSGSTDKYSFRRPTVTDNVSSDTEFVVNSSINSHTSISSIPVFSNRTGSSWVSNSTDTGRFKNSTESAIKPVTTNTSSLLNINNMTIGTLNTTGSAPFLNITQGTAMNETSTAKFSNSTVSAPYMNIPHTPFPNATAASPLNTTHALPTNQTISALFANTTSTPPPTPTLDSACGATAAPFTVQVSQPDRLFDGWYLQMSGDAIIFTPLSSSATHFSVEDTGHLCAVGYLGSAGNAVIAIAENGTETTGSAVYFLDPTVLGGIAQTGYAALRCAVGTGTGSGLACSEGAKAFWVGCGLGLDITSDGDGVAVVDGRNCTGVALEAVYS
ncbi:hypothetical protein F5B20DRAFT_508318 [Whalleya microplaca]|nr:hypothetical protein F5B20DRAFT_508318 [Whalleya microplaca]